MPGPITHWSWPGRSRTAELGEAAEISSTSVLQHQRGLALDVEADQAVAQVVEPPADGLAAGAQALAEPVVQVVGRRGAVGAEVRRDCSPPRLVDVGKARPAGHRVEPPEGGMTVAGRPEADVALPHQRLEQRVGLAGEAGGRQPVAPLAGQGRGELLAGERNLGHGVADRLAERRPVGRGQAVGLDPAGQLPLAAGRAERQVVTRLRRRSSGGWRRGRCRPSPPRRRRPPERRRRPATPRVVR